MTPIDTFIQAATEALARVRPHTAATVLNSSRAVEMTVHVVRAFVQLRDLLASNRQLAEKFAELERKVSSHDQAIVGILKAIRELMHPPLPRKRPSGFTANFDEQG